MYSDDERLCSIALSLCPGINKVLTKRLVTVMGSAAEVFRRHTELHAYLPDLSPTVIQALNHSEVWKRAEREMAFVEKNRVKCLTLNDEAYPLRLRECEDAPVVLFFKGNTDLNKLRVVAMVGTRQATDYGKQFCADFVRDLAAYCPDVLIVSGLAYGIDIHSHRAALEQHVPTVGILAHGLDRIYPAVHRSTAIEMLACGGLLTEYIAGSIPEQYRFVGRNRIVAGMSDATVVVQSASKGGSLITAEFTSTYNRDCFAVPGSIYEVESAGCNQLIRDNRASLIQNAEDFVKAMNWGTDKPDAHAAPVQRTLFPDLTADEQCVVRLLSQRGDLHINTLVVAANIPVSKMSGLLFGLEMKGVVKTLVGNKYHLLG